MKTVEHDGKDVHYIEVEPSDIALAERLLGPVLGEDEDLPPQTRRLLALVAEYVCDRAARDDVEPALVRFTRRQVREHTAWGHTQLKVHLRRLEDLEYLVRHGGGPRQRILYTLAWAGEGGNGWALGAPATRPGLSRARADISDLGAVVGGRR